MAIGPAGAFPGFYPYLPIQNIPEPKVKEPEPFTGKDPQKIRDFVAQCSLVFASSPRRYASEEAKVFYAGSYLTEIASSWFQPHLLSHPPSALLTDWETFCRELNMMFGDRNLASTSERKLRELTMLENHQAARYIIDFQKHAPYTGYNDAALASEFYRGLANRIKDVMALSGRARDMIGLRDQALEIDRRYWEREQERPKGTVSSTPRTTTSATNRTPSQTTESNPKSSNTTATKTSGTTQASAVGKDLDASGHLKEAEKDRRKRLGLCLYCAEKGHPLWECPAIPVDRRPKPPPDNKSAQTTATGRATFTISADSDAVVSDCYFESENEETTQ
jgi:hypothetical protein